MLNTALVSKGYGEMALSGSTAGPLFNLLFGFGISLVSQTYNGNLDFPFFNWDSLKIHIALGVLVLNFVRLFLTGMAVKYKLTRQVGIVGVLLYLAFIASVTVAEYAV